MKNKIPFEIIENNKEDLTTGQSPAVLKAIGVGGGGGNTINHILKKGIDRVECFAANTDAQALIINNVKQENKIQIGKTLTKGLGAGTLPEKGKQSAEENEREIEQAIAGANMLFITAGMGGGTGTGAAPVIAKIAMELDILTVAVVTTPFNYEGSKKMEFALDGIKELEKYVDSLIIIPNEKILEIYPEAQINEAFERVNDVLYNAVSSISEIIHSQGQINVDFADLQTIMSENGVAMMGTATASGPDRAEKATIEAVSSPLLSNIDLRAAKGILVNITCDNSLTMPEFEKINDILNQYKEEVSTFKFGTVNDPNMGDSIKITIIATGLKLKDEGSGDSIKEILDRNSFSNRSNRETKNLSNDLEANKKQKFGNAVGIKDLMLDNNKKDTVEHEYSGFTMPSQLNSGNDKTVSSLKTKDESSTDFLRENRDKDDNGKKKKKGLFGFITDFVKANL